MRKSASFYFFKRKPIPPAGDKYETWREVAKLANLSPEARLRLEWLYDGNLTMDCDEFNRDVTGWLIEYNFQRPHQTLDYLTPMEYIENEVEKSSKVLRMWSASTVDVFGWDRVMFGSDWPVCRLAGEYEEDAL